MPADKQAGGGRPAGPGQARRRRPPASRPAGARPRSSRAGAGPARRAACDVLRAVAERDAYANLLLPALITERGLDSREAALATELAYGVLRSQGTYDAILTVCCDRDLAQIDPPLREVLRLGTHQLLATRIGAHAAVATSVDLTREVAGPRPAGFVNAVLRRVAMRDLAGWLQIAAPRRADDLAGHLSVRYSHPRWIVAALSEALGEDPAGELAETEHVLAADQQRPQVTLCAVPGLAGQGELAAAGAAAARWSPFGAYLAHGDPGQIRAVAEGRAGVQDEASQLAALALARARPADSSSGHGLGAGSDAGSVWLDACAGPGGKARLLAGLAAGQGARLLAGDVRPHRARLARQAIGSIPGTGVIVADGTVPAWRPGTFGRVLADVPCSGLGALRRRPEARWRRDAGDIAGFGPLQRTLLAAALDAAAPGGLVAYVTCSPHAAETRAVVTAVVGSRTDTAILDAPAVLPDVPDLRCPAPHTAFAQFWPHRHGTDAIFLALLQRRRPR